MIEGYDYYLVYEKNKLTLKAVKVDAKEENSLLRLTGRTGKEAVKNLLDELAPIGGMRLIESSPEKRVYGVRADLAPLIGSYMLLLRRSIRPEKWDWVLEELLKGDYAMFGEYFSSYLSIALDISKGRKRMGSKMTEKYSILPDIADATSSSMKKFFSIMKKRGKSKR